MSTKTITCKTKAWLTEHSYVGPEDMKTGDPKLIHSMAFNPNAAMTTMGWTLVGEATITVEAVDTSVLIENKVEALRAEQKKARAEAAAADTRYEAQIQKLLAITYEPEAA